MALWLSLPWLSIPKCTVHIPARTIRGPGLYGWGAFAGVRYIVTNPDATAIRERDAKEYCATRGEILEKELPT